MVGTSPTSKRSRAVHPETGIILSSHNTCDACDRHHHRISFEIRTPKILWYGQDCDGWLSMICGRVFRFQNGRIELPSFSILHQNNSFQAGAYFRPPGSELNRRLI